MEGILSRIFSQAVEYQRQGELDKAIASYTEFTRLRKDDFSAWLNLANLYDEIGCISQELFCYYQIIRINQQFVDYARDRIHKIENPNPRSFMDRFTWNIDAINTPAIEDAFGCSLHYDEKELLRFAELCSDRKLLLDVGALFGIFSLIFTQDRSRTAIAFEPSEKAFPTLCKNAYANPDRRIITEKYFIGERKQFSEFKYNGTEEKPGMHAEVTRARNRSDKFNTISIDEYCSENNLQPDVIKVDVEGFEMSALKGARKTLTNCRPLLFLEVHRERMKGYDDSIEDMLTLFNDVSYRVDLSEIDSDSADDLLNSGNVTRVLCTPL